MKIVVVVTSAGLTLGRTTIQVSDDVAAHAVLSVASQDLTAELRFE